MDIQIHLNDRAEYCGATAKIDRSEPLPRHIRRQMRAAKTREAADAIALSWRRLATRARMKQAAFAYVYGAGPSKIQGMSGLNPADADSLIKDFRRRFPGIGG